MVKIYNISTLYSGYFILVSWCDGSVDRGGSDEVTNRGVNDEVLF